MTTGCDQDATPMPRNTVTVTRNQVFEFFKQWETNARAGNCLTLEETRAREVPEIAETNAKNFFAVMTGEDDEL